MNCHKCNTEMSVLGCKITEQNLYWCPRCGCLKPCDAGPLIPVLAYTTLEVHGQQGDDNCWMDIDRYRWQLVNATNADTLGQQQS